MAKKNKQRKELKQNESSFKLIGKIEGLEKENAYKVGKGRKGTKSEGVPFRSLNISIRTSENNVIRVGLYGSKPDKVFLWNSEKKKKDADYKGDRIEFDKYIKNKQKYSERGYTVLQMRIGYEFDENDKLITQGLTKYEAAKSLFDNLTNGDTVLVEGDISYSEYENRQGEIVHGTNYNISKIYVLKKEIDFEDEKFEEVSYFEQQGVFVSAINDRQKKEAKVNLRLIDYHGNFKDRQFTLSYKDEDGNEIAEMKQLANSFEKKLKFGDLINVYGEVLNKAVAGEASSEDLASAKDALALLGGKRKPKHADKNVSYISGLFIEGVDSWEVGFYSKEDFVAALESESKSDNGLGGKKKPDIPEVDDEDVDIDEGDFEEDNSTDDGDDDVNLDDDGDDDITLDDDGDDYDGDDDIGLGDDDIDEDDLPF